MNKVASEGIDWKDVVVYHAHDILFWLSDNCSEIKRNNNVDNIIRPAKYQRILSIIGLSLSVLLIICIFLPFLDYGGGTFSLWEYLDRARSNGTGIIIIIELLV